MCGTSVGAQEAPLLGVCMYVQESGGPCSSWVDGHRRTTKSAPHVVSPPPSASPVSCRRPVTAEGVAVRVSWLSGHPVPLVSRRGEEGVTGGQHFRATNYSFPDGRQPLLNERDSPPHPENAVTLPLRFVPFGPGDEKRQALDRVSVWRSD